MLNAMLYIMVTLFWGGAWYANRVVMEHAGGFPIYIALALRFGIAAVIMAVVAGSIRNWSLPSRRVVALNFKAGLLMAVCYLLCYKAEEVLSGGLSAVLGTLSAVVILALAALKKKEVVSCRAWVGISVAIGGIAVMSLERADVGGLEQVIAILLAIGSAAAYGGGTFVLQQQTTEDKPLDSMVVLQLTLALALTGWAILQRQAVPGWNLLSGRALAAMIYLVIFATVAAFGGYVLLTRRVSSFTLATLVLTEPLVAMVVDCLWERQVILSWRSYIGAAIVLLGVIPVALKREPDLTPMKQR